MTSLNTLPLPHRPPIADTHEHAWLTESRHPTSDGVIRYVRCVECGSRRVDLQPYPHTPPRAISGELASPPAPH